VVERKPQEETEPKIRRRGGEIPGGGVDCAGDRRDIYQKCGLVDDIGGWATKRALLGGGELARTRSLGTRGAGRGSNRKKRCERGIETRSEIWRGDDRAKL